ncbi:MAG: winged helix-turn-helix domain-containing protein [Nitrososphaeraceae archaeon]|jgi:predicted transcriptional regulator
MKYRSRTDIVKLILEAANGGGANKSKLMYKAFLSFAQLKEYVTLLLENGLLGYEEGNHFYRTTDKGMRLLQIYNRMEELTLVIKSGKEAQKSDYHTF